MQLLLIQSFKEYNWCLCNCGATLKRNTLTACFANARVYEHGDCQAGAERWDEPWRDEDPIAADKIANFSGGRMFSCSMSFI